MNYTINLLRIPRFIKDEFKQSLISTFLNIGKYNRYRITYIVENFVRNHFDAGNDQERHAIKERFYAEMSLHRRLIDEVQITYYRRYDTEANRLVLITNIEHNNGNVVVMPRFPETVIQHTYHTHGNVNDAGINTSVPLYEDQNLIGGLLICDITSSVVNDTFFIARDESLLADFNTYCARITSFSVPAVRNGNPVLQVPTNIYGWASVSPSHGNGLQIVDIHDIVCFRYTERLLNCLVVGYEVDGKIIYDKKSLDEIILKNPTCFYRHWVHVIGLAVHNSDIETPAMIKRNKIGKLIAITVTKKEAVILKTNEAEYYKRLSDCKKIKVKLNEDISDSLNLFGRHTIRNKIHGSQKHPILFKYMKFLKKSPTQTDDGVTHSALFPQESSSKDIKFLISDVRFLFVNLKGYNHPVVKEMNLGSNVIIRSRDGVKNSLKYTINKISRYKISTSMKHSSCIQKLDVLHLVNGSDFIKIEAKNVKLV